MRTIRFVTQLLLLALAPIGACSCEEDTIREVTPGTCEPTFACNQGFTYRLGACQVSRCQDDSECCPGQRCSIAAGLCANQWKACTDDTECVELPGQRCIDFRDGRFCGYPNRTETLTEAGTQACASREDCAAGASCVGGRCLVAAPCGGGCAPGEVCDIDSNTCFALPSCELECANGQILVVADPESMSGDACCLVECACATLPPIEVGQYGWHASVATTPTDVFVSAYDAEYGDLVVARYDLSGVFQDVEYVDGFPNSGPIEANPGGRRGGRRAPGPDVGEYTSMAVDNAGNLHVAYYDRSEGQLRHALRTTSGWQHHAVDTNGDVGRFTSLALGPEGRPRISYMVVEAMDGGQAYSALRYAEAQVAAPSRAEDWQISEIERKTKAPPICGGGCARSEACVDLGRGPSCVAEATGCSACGTNEVCVMDTGGTVCALEIDVASTLDDLPEGVGLFSSLAVTSTGAVYVAYYDKTDGALRLAWPENGTFATRTVDGAGPEDVGAHVSAAIGPNDLLALAYMDFTRDDLIYIEPKTGVRQIIDDGVSPPDLRMVGADASLVFDGAGQPTVAYQDGTRLDLVYARRTGTPALWSTERLRGGNGASGFYASQAQRNGQAFVASVAVGFDAESNLQLELTVDVRNVP